MTGQSNQRELVGHPPVVCPSPGVPGTVFGYPACVYGFFMYLIIAAIAVAGLVMGRRRTTVMYRGRSR